VSLYGRYARVDTFELDWLSNDHDEALRRVDRHVTHPAGTVYDLDKAWHAVFFLLDRAGAPMAAIVGEEPLWEPKDDDEYAPTVVPPHNVATAAAFLASMPAQRLGTHFDREALAAADIYPPIWHRHDDPRPWLLDRYAGLPEYFSQAAHYGGALLFWVD
jgi:Domain of unknown function (DUF1877)